MLVCPAASLHRSDGLLRYRNFNLFSIAYASLPRLRSRLTLRRRSLLRNPRAFGGLDSHQPFRYSYQHSHFLPLHGSLRYRFSVIRTLPYPHLILTFFNRYRFGPPHIFTCVSAWTWVDHCGFGSTHSDSRPIKTRFRFGSAFPA